MTEKINEQILKLEIFKLITEYQIRWLSTSYDIPSLSWQIITKKYPFISSTAAAALIKEWMTYEGNCNIAVFSKARFNEDSNVETILKLQGLIKQIDANIIKLKEFEETEKREAEEGPAFSVEKKDDEVTITFFRKSWFKRANVISLSVQEAQKLKSELEAKLATTT
jgi:hypothetical protein